MSAALEDLFPGWATAWRQQQATSAKLDRVRELRGRRAAGNQSVPHLQIDPTFRRAFTLYPGMRDAEVGRTDLPLAQAYAAHEAAVRAFTPVVLRAFWARWLHLERALELASRSGDLLFGAVALRTMLEDVWALRELQRLDAELPLPEGYSATLSDLQRIRTHGGLLWTRFLPPDADRPTPTGDAAPRPFNRPEDRPLQETFQRLNDYVHPNYGSHLLALFPERSAAAGPLLDGFIAVYQAFLEIPWAEAAVSQPYTLLPPPELRPWPKEVELLHSQVLPEIQHHLAARGHAAISEDPAPGVRDWVGPRRDLEEMLHSLPPDYFDDVQPALDVATVDRSKAESIARSLLGREYLGVPRRLMDLLMLPSYRLAALEMEQKYPRGAPQPQASPEGWLDFTMGAISVAVLTTLHKMHLLTAALIRQLNARNPIGALLAMRSLVEHRAVALWLGQRLGRAWEEATGQTAPGNFPWRSLQRLETDLARFLAGTRGTEEEHTSWKAQWATAGVDRVVPLGGAVREGLAQEQTLQYLWDYGSKVLHGFRARGVELCPPTEALYVTASLARALCAADLVYAEHAELDIMAPFGRLLTALKAVRGVLSESGTEMTPLLHVAGRAHGAEPLQAGRDYRGQGTESDPYVFATGLSYYEAFTKLCGQLGFDTQQRRPQFDAARRLMDVVPGPDREHFFLAPLSHA